jgi:hypothetical protein
VISKPPFDVGAEKEMEAAEAEVATATTAVGNPGSVFVLTAGVVVAAALEPAAFTALTEKV